ncbi:MAG: hypothetical protein JWP87_4980 [Labilithrix sp.]|nr:hypothetical protein [Labilithrix sp.]
MIYSYVVRSLFDDVRVFDAYVGWLRDVHVGDMCMSGARDADLLVMDATPGEPLVVESHYRFVSREAFEKYEREHAPRLRAQSLAELARLGVEPGRGVTVHRATGKALAWRRQ